MTFRDALEGIGAGMVFACVECGYIVHRYALNADDKENLCFVCRWLNENQNLTDAERKTLRGKLMPK